MKEYIIKVDDDISKRDINGGMPLLETPQELIRCKDCKHSKRMYQPWNDLICEKHGRANTPDWFCADGKPKEFA